MVTPHTPRTTVALPPVEVIYTDETTGELLAVTVQTTIKDRSAYEVHAHKNGWPTDRPMQTATFLWSGFLAWSALRREPDAPAQLRTATPDEFFEKVMEVMPITDDEDMPHANPTQAAAGSEHA